MTDIKLQIHTNDECAILINAYDAMIITIEAFQGSPYSAFADELKRLSEGG